MIIRVVIVALCLLSFKAFAGEKDVPPSSQPIRVVATFSVLGDMVQEIGGPEVSVKTLVGWGQDAHVYRPSPKDVKHLAQAEVLIENGLGFEGWLSRLVKSSHYKGLRVVASQGVEPLIGQGDLEDYGDDHDDHARHSHHHYHDHAGEEDPHAWHSPVEARRYVLNIMSGLKSARPALAEVFERNANRYLAELDQIHAGFSSLLSGVENERKSFVVPHNAFAYLGRDYGLKIYSLQGLSTETDASAARVAKVIKRIRELNVGVAFMENVADNRLIQRVQKETNVALGGELMSGALSKDSAASYLAMLRHNLEVIGAALRP